MDASEVKRIVETHVDILKEALALFHWRITISYDPERDGWKASCDRNGGDYLRAAINIDPAKHGDEDDVVESLKHELIHLLLTPFDVYRNVLTAGVDEDSVEGQRELALWAHVVEQATVNIERGLGRLLPQLERREDEEMRAAIDQSFEMLPS